MTGQALGELNVGDERVDEFTVEGRHLTDVGGTIAMLAFPKPPDERRVVQVPAQ